MTVGSLRGALLAGCTAVGLVDGGMLAGPAAVDVDDDDAAVARLPSDVACAEPAAAARVAATTTELSRCDADVPGAAEGAEAAPQ
ncbi:MAG TPA: hypothetical protein VMV45_11190 [Casimicrobiaceae bacterium]|nr:hypothetical protein [Casimicrobiaceae bacterium]